MVPRRVPGSTGRGVPSVRLDDVEVAWQTPVASMRTSTRPVRGRAMRISYRPLAGGAQDHALSAKTDEIGASE